MSSFIATGYKGGNSDYKKPNGFGLKIPKYARDDYFEKSDGFVKLQLKGREKPIEVNIDKNSFWGDCRELIHREIGKWLIENNFAPWQKRHPPKFKMTRREPRLFDVEKIDD
ncbi:hypothetical protein ACQZ6A_20035 [Agrobacterium vitis]